MWRFSECRTLCLLPPILYYTGNQDLNLYLKICLTKLSCNASIEGDNIFERDVHGFVWSSSSFYGYVLSYLKTKTYETLVFIVLVGALADHFSICEFNNGIKINIFILVYFMNNLNTNLRKVTDQTSEQRNVCL